MKKPQKRNRHSGFALIVTLSLMILLTVIAVGLLTLSSITLRSSSQGAAQAVANSNARLALMLAIGDLQKFLGPDQRVSSNAGGFSATSPQRNVVGVWDSLGFKGPSGSPPMPSEKAAKFRAWLVSTKLPESAADFKYTSKPLASDSIWLVNPATTGMIGTNNQNKPDTNDPTMKAERVPLAVGSTRGGLAWMVSDNSVKAALNIKSNPSTQFARNIANRTAPTAPRPDVVSDAFAKITEPWKMVSVQTAALAVGKTNIKEVNARTQAFTSSSLGLLTNPVTGGLKTDLTPLMESTNSSVLTTALGPAIPYFTAADGGPSWAFLRTHYQLYKRLTGVSGAVPRFRLLPNTDIVPGTTGIQQRPAKELLLPVIAKLQIVFSLVSHNSHIGERVQAFDKYGIPVGNASHAVPHLVYDPIVTLYNPYDVEIQLSTLRIRISDPPVGFQFQKHDKLAGTDPWYRQQFAAPANEFHGMGRFQLDNEANPDARKSITLSLKDKTSTNVPGGDIILLPGELRIFSPWVDNKWTWGFETAGGYAARAFFDYSTSTNFANTDGRTGNKKGVETVPGLNFVAGLQTDHLSYGGKGASRSDESKYPWEIRPPNIQPKDWHLGEGWLSLKLEDSITVNAKPQRCVKTVGLPDFRVDVLAGANDNPDTDVMRTYEFRLKDVASEMSTTGKPSAVISRKFVNGDIYQGPKDETPAGKSPFALFTMTAKTTKSSRDDSKAWALNNLVTEGGSHDSSKIGNAAQSYDLSLRQIQDFTEIEYDSKTNRGYYGAQSTTAGGATVVPMYRVPVTPAASLGDWVAANLVNSSQFPRVNYALGNSFANPLVPCDQVSSLSPMGGGAKALDHAYLMNAVMWDNYYFSSATAYSSAAFSPTRAKPQVLQEFFNGTAPMLNSRLVPYLSGSGNAAALAADYGSKIELAFSKEFAKNAMINGAFNINSDSIDAWRAVLSSMRDATVKGYLRDFPVDKKTAFVRTGLPVAGSSDDLNPANSVNADGQIRWAGFRTLTDAQIEKLASLIVDEIRARAIEDSSPSLCLGDFINRRLGTSTGLHALRGILQTAIDKSGINTNQDSLTINSSNLAPDRILGLVNKEALDGLTADGAPPMLSQGDILTALAPVITVRGDTFTVRSYGESRALNGTTVVARAWCEAVVQRVPEYVDATDSAEAATTALTPINKLFGRKFVITSFRFLNASEI